VTLGDSINDTLLHAKEAARGGLDPVWVLVPDRFTLHAEDLLTRGAGALLNVRVLTFSMMFNVLSAEMGETPKVMDKLTATLLLWQAIRDVEMDLVWFRGAARHLNFAERTFNTLNQLTSSMVNFDKLESSARHGVTKSKIQDLVKIYRRYTELKLAGEYSDSAGQLAWLLKHVSGISMLGDVKLFVCGFEHLSAQRLAVLDELKKACGQVIIGARNGSELQSQLGQAKIKQAAAKVTYPTLRLFKTTQEEAEVVSNNVRGLISQGVEPREIVLLLADFDNTHEQFVATLTASGVPVNLDTGVVLREAAVTRFALDFLMLVSRDTAENFLAVARSILPPEEFFEVENLSIKRSWGLGRQESVNLDKLRALVAKARKKKNVGEIVAVVEKVIAELALSIESEDARKLDELTRERLVEILQKVKNLMGDVKMDMREVANLLATLTGAVKISLTPTFANRVLVASLAEWQPSNTAHIFVCNTVDGNFPARQDDTDLLTMQDIKNIGQRIQPSAGEQNARNRRHVLNVIESAREGLSVSHVGEASSEIFEKLVGMFPQEFVDEKINCRRFASLRFLSALGDGSAFDDPIYYKSLQTAIGLELGGEKNVEVCGRDFLPENQVSVTTLERFIACPRCAYLERALRLRPRDTAGVAPHIVGQLLHKIAEEWTKSYLAGKSDDVVKRVFSDPKFTHWVGNPTNAPVIMVLRREAQSIVKMLENHAKDSDFKPKIAEKRLTGEIVVNKEKFELVGIVDRIDENDLGQQMVIDFKTGTSWTKYPQLQLPLYMSFLKNAVGAVYMPLVSGFSKDRKIKGFMAGEDHTAAIASARESANFAIADMLRGVIEPSADCGRCKWV